MTPKRGAVLGTGAAAEKAGILPATFRKELRRARRERAAGRDRPGLLPEPDGAASRDVNGQDRGFWWYEGTIEAWLAARPGAGTRTDLVKPKRRKPAAS